jgi:cytochrome P450
MTATLLSRSEEFYPHPNEWDPERFIQNPRLTKDSLAFSRGTRICLGVSLPLECPL